MSNQPQNYARPPQPTYNEPPYTDKKEQLMDQGLKHALKELKIEDMYEVQDIRLKMPRMNLTNFEHWDTFLENPDCSKKLKFLQKTVYNTKQIKKTLDLRKMSELERTGKLK